MRRASAVADPRNPTKAVQPERWEAISARLRGLSRESTMPPPRCLHVPGTHRPGPVRKRHLRRVGVDLLTGAARRRPDSSPASGPRSPQHSRGSHAHRRRCQTTIKADIGSGGSPGPDWLPCGTQFDTDWGGACFFRLWSREPNPRSSVTRGIEGAAIRRSAITSGKSRNAAHKYRRQSTPSNSCCIRTRSPARSNTRKQVSQWPIEPIAQRAALSIGQLPSG
jgi:hypothetical protein